MVPLGVAVVFQVIVVAVEVAALLHDASLCQSVAPASLPRKCHPGFPQQRHGVFHGHTYFLLSGSSPWLIEQPFLSTDRQQSLNQLDATQPVVPK